MSGEAGQLAAGAPSRRGVKTKLLGAIVMMLGVLDSLLTLRGGVPAYEFLMLVLLGAAVFAVGAVRGANAPGARPLPSSDPH